MPNYKMVDADALDGAMLATAEAIRTKGGTEELIAWNKSTGYKEAIEAIKVGGGGLNFTVVGGTTQPESPAENTVWVDTGTEITGWEFGFDQPDTTVSGFVWIKASSSSQMELNVNDENVFAVRVSSAYQMIDGSWVFTPIKVFSNGEWMDDYGVIYDGTWRSPYKFEENELIDNNANPIQWECWQSSRAIVYNVDFTDFDVLELDCEFVNNYWTILSVTDESRWVDGIGSAFTYTRIGEGTFARQIYPLQVTDITGSHMIKIHLWGTGGTVKVFGIKLVKNG